MDIEAIASSAVDAMIKVHRATGPGLLESAYETCLTYELRKRGLKVACQVPLPIFYDGIHLETAYRLDRVLADCIIIENKAVEVLLPIHEAQLLTYMRLNQSKLGFLVNWNVKLVNWNVKLIKDGIHRRAL